MKEGTVIPQTPGTTGQVLTSTGAGSAPTFQTAASGAPNVATGNFSRANNLASGTQAITGLSFTPVAVIFVNSGGSNPAASIGVDDGSNGQCVANNHNETANDWQFIGDCIRFRYAPGDVQSASITSFQSNGFTLTWVKAGSPTGETASMGFLAIG